MHNFCFSMSKHCSFLHCLRMAHRDSISSTFSPLRVFGLDKRRLSPVPPRLFTRGSTASIETSGSDGRQGHERLSDFDGST